MEGPTKICTQKFQPFWHLMDTNKQTDTQAKYILDSVITNQIIWFSIIVIFPLNLFFFHPMWIKLQFIRKMKIYDKLISNYGLSKFVESHFRENRSLKSLNNCRNCIILFDRWIEASRNFSFQICLSRMFFQQSFFKQQNIFCNTICVQLYTMTLYSCKIYQVHRTHTFTAD